MNRKRKLLRVVCGLGIPALLAAIFLSFATLRSGAVTTVTQLFYDGFNGSSLDTSRWMIVDGGSWVQVTGGFLQTVSGQDHKEVNSIPNFAPMGHSVVAKARIRLAGQFQKFGFNVNYLGPATGFYFDTYDDRDGNIENTIRALVWFVPTSGAPVNLLDVTVPVTWYEFHEFAVDWRATEVIFLIDNVEAARVPVTFGGALPVGVWNDRGSLMQTDWVEVSQVITNTTICHKPGTPAQKTLVIPQQALAGHLGHGDTIGPCG